MPAPERTDGRGGTREHPGLGDHIVHAQGLQRRGGAALGAPPAQHQVPPARRGQRVVGAGVWCHTAPGLHRPHRQPALTTTHGAMGAEVGAHGLISGLISAWKRARQIDFQGGAERIYADVILPSFVRNSCQRQFRMCHPDTKSSTEGTPSREFVGDMRHMGKAHMGIGAGA